MVCELTEPPECRYHDNRITANQLGLNTPKKGKNKTKQTSARAK